MVEATRPAGIVDAEHPHLHCIVPGGGIAPRRSSWVACRPRFLFPVKVLSRLFRAKFVAYVKSAWRDGKLGFHGKLQDLPQRPNFTLRLKRITQREWVVYAKPPFGGPHQVLKYLARYTHRVAISNQRLLALQDGQVSFRWKDYTHAGQPTTMTLQAAEFIRRFLLHVLPRGFVKIRYFGFLANRDRTDNIQLCRKLLDAHSRNLAWACRLPGHRKPTHPIAVRSARRDACGQWRCRGRIRRFAEPAASRRQSWRLRVILHESVRKDTFDRACLRDSRSCMGICAPTAKLPRQTHLLCAHTSAPCPACDRGEPDF